MKIPVIIDTDPGVDDAIALFLAFSSDKLDIRAVTTVGGNIPLEKTTKNSIDLVSYFGKSAKISKGASGPLLRELETAEWVHGASGIASVKLPKGNIELYEKNAWDTIYEEAIKFEGKLNIITLGPLTNIAIALMKYPDLKDKIERITLMGGACYIGNTTPAAEFNIYVDAEAADIVFKSGIPLTMVGLDATHKAVVLEEEINEITSSGNRVSSVVKELFQSCLSVCKLYGAEGAIVHDALAVAAVIDPSIISKKEYYVSIETKGELTYGKTVVDIYDVTKNKPNVEVALGVDRERFVQMFKGMMREYA
ncbi:nucleoside hydrolase [Clostridium sp. MSJ-11]|uniref:Nucleoside hydrolase n=1 Tax=Clostridium mobile TaxID=2841512 RepID=A0ABS6EM26_9CLOT|nr:nucleoside hydrolase [Clostridium mobile]MBU5486177.1 nucleoside hydrolase [Clostridium mobile]